MASSGTSRIDGDHGRAWSGRAHPQPSVSRPYPKTWQLTTSTSRRSSPKNADSRFETLMKGVSLLLPAWFQLAIGTMRKRWCASGETWVFQKSLRSWLLVTVPPR